MSAAASDNPAPGQSATCGTGVSEVVDRVVAMTPVALALLWNALTRTGGLLLVAILVLVTSCGEQESTSFPTPTGEFLCSLGSRDGEPCNGDSDCPGGFCIVGQGVCDGGDDDGFPCDCARGTCVDDTCSGGPLAGLACDPMNNCAGNTPCIGTQKVCLGGIDRGFSCLRDAQCPGSRCQSTVPPTPPCEFECSDEHRLR